MIAARTAIRLALLVAPVLGGVAACGSSETSGWESQPNTTEPVKSTRAADAGSAAAAPDRAFCNARAFDGGCAYIH